jgi:tetratricopeptide (TPR) repeat protein
MLKDIILFVLNAGLTLLTGNKADTTTPLTIKWDNDLNNDSIFSLLHWRRRLSKFHGREKELKELREWLYDGSNVSLKFIIGKGGTGKTRLAAEFAETYGKYDGWSTGFVSLTPDASYSFNPDNNLLLLIDYPEQYPKAVDILLRSLAKFPNKRKLRILFLSRKGWDEWQDTFIDAEIDRAATGNPIFLDKLDPKAAFEVYKSAAENALEIFNKDSDFEIDPKLIHEWLEKAPENNRALYVVGAALKYALEPERHNVGYSIAEVIDSLVERELRRLREATTSYMNLNKWAFAKLLAMATFAGEVSVEKAIEWTERDELKLGFRGDHDIHELLEQTHLIEDGVIKAPEPDIVAAWFALKVFVKQNHIAPEMLWAALELKIEDNLRRFERIEYDVSLLLHEAGDKASDLIRGEKHSPNWLKTAVEKDDSRCPLLEDYFNDAGLTQCFLPTAILVFETLVRSAKNYERLSFLLIVLATLYSNNGENPKALKAIQEAVNIDRRLAEVNPARFEPSLAGSLNNMSAFLLDTGDNVGALEAIREAVEIRRRLSSGNPARLEPGLAASLNNMSNIFSNTGDNVGALEAIREAVEIRRRLSSVNPTRFEPDQARSLNNLSLRLSDTGDNAGALETIGEAVEIFRRLSSGNPARFEHDLAVSLDNMSSKLSDAGNNSDAMEAISEAVERYRRLATDNPARFEPGLAASLNNMSNRLSDTDDNAGALEVIRVAVEICRRLAKDNPNRFIPDLAMSIGNWGDRFLETGNPNEAILKYEEAVELVKPYGEMYPNGEADRIYQNFSDQLLKAKAKLSGEGV